MHSPSRDPGFVRWYVFIPGQGRFVVPPGTSDREAYALSQGATRLDRGNENVWTRPVGSGHLGVAR